MGGLRSVRAIVLHRLRSIMMAKMTNTISAKLNKTISIVAMTIVLYLQAFEPLMREGPGYRTPASYTAMTAIKSDAAWRLA
jgi:hypothetical protein